MVTVLLIIAAYVWGSVPTANVFARLGKGVDLRQVGSGSVTSSNVGELLGKWATVVVGILDVLKGASAIWVAQALDQSVGEQMGVGIAAVAGHNWSFLLGFHGGRGMTVFCGALIAAAQLEMLMFITIAVFGVAFYGNVPAIMGLATLLTPLWSFAFSREDALIWGTAVMVALIAFKRLTGNWTPLPVYGKGSVVMNRLVYDRDTKDREEWVRRTLEAPFAHVPTERPADGPGG